jgi:hypothetical protein
MRTTICLSLILGGFLASCGSSSSSTDASTDKGTGGGGGAGGSTGAGKTSHCDVAGNSTCLEWAPDFTPSREAGCNVQHGTLADGPCSSTNSSGGCRRANTGQGTETLYFYMPITVDDVKATCVAQANAVYIAP